jgi:hypothetical protein
MKGARTLFCRMSGEPRSSNSYNTIEIKKPEGYKSGTQFYGNDWKEYDRAALMNVLSECAIPLTFQVELLVKVHEFHSSIPTKNRATATRTRRVPRLSLRQPKPSERIFAPIARVQIGSISLLCQAHADNVGFSAGTGRFKFSSNCCT